MTLIEDEYSKSDTLAGLAMPIAPNGHGRAKRFLSKSFGGALPNRAGRK